MVQFEKGNRIWKLDVGPNTREAVRKKLDGEGLKCEVIGWDLFGRRKAKPSSNVTSAV